MKNNKEIIYFEKEFQIKPDQFKKSTHVVQVVHKGQRNTNAQGYTSDLPSLKNKQDYELRIRDLEKVKNSPAGVKYFIIKGSEEECKKFIDRK